MYLSENAKKAVEILEKSGHEAYFVGGCVRDAIMGKRPADTDITTSALPEETKAAFHGFRVFETGLKHGTVTVVINGENIEITTFRTDGEYTDFRRPSSVSFTRDIKSDLARRDFTINAIAYSEKRGFIDPFGGREDIKRGVIRCVGSAEKRFSEDALRILRAMRFASVLGFNITPETKRAMEEKAFLIGKISAERVFGEFRRLLRGECPSSILRDNTSIIAVFIPEIAAMVGFKQRSRYHSYDVWEHTLRAVDSVKNTDILRLAAFFHDIAKPCCHSEENGCDHFYGHPNAGAEKAREILIRLKAENDIKSQIFTLIKYHDIDCFPSEKWVKKWLNRLGEALFTDLIELKKADIKAQNGELLYRLAEMDELLEIKDAIIRAGKCFSLKALAVKGGDMLELGFAGREIGIILRFLLDEVMEARLENDRVALLSAAQAQRDVQRRK